jgi:hypothetical protein
MDRIAVGNDDECETLGRRQRLGREMAVRSHSAVAGAGHHPALLLRGQMVPRNFGPAVIFSLRRVVFSALQLRRPGTKEAAVA